jgi:antirestriction protein ArdC
MLNKAEEAVADILKSFENPHDLPKPLAQVFVNRKDGAPCRGWSWRNQLIVALRGHEEARGYRQWEQVGRKVRPGEKAFRILSPLAKKVVDEKTEEERTAVFAFKGTPVFGLRQTEGEPLPDRSEETRRWLDSLPLRDVAEAWGLSVDAYNGRGGERLGVYQHGTGIALGVENLSTWCHELVHAADDRNGTLRGKKVQKETVAELGGAVVLRILGYEHEVDLGGCWEYIQSYAKKEGIDVLAACGAVLDRTCEAVALILDTAEELQKARVATTVGDQV